MLSASCLSCRLYSRSQTSLRDLIPMGPGWPPTSTRLSTWPWRWSFVFLLDGLASLLTRLLPDPPKTADPSAPLYLDETAVHMPSVALACAARETLHMGDVVERMLRQAMTALMSNDRKLAAEVSRMDNIVDRLDEAIKLYVTKVTRESLDDRDGRRAMEIIAFAINLEHIGDIIDKNLMELANKKIKHKYEFSKEGATELAMFTSALLKT